MRLEPHWSQDQLVEISGLRMRTIPRIENGENAGLESLKPLAAVFEITILATNNKKEIEQIRKEETCKRILQAFCYCLIQLSGSSCYCYN
jgi:transcriptional regulator with XRE-family HTH domain